MDYDIGGVKFNIDTDKELQDYVKNILDKQKLHTELSAQDSLFMKDLFSHFSRKKKAAREEIKKILVSRRMDDDGNYYREACFKVLFVSGGRAAFFSSKECVDNFNASGQLHVV